VAAVGFLTYLSAWEGYLDAVPPLYPENAIEGKSVLWVTAEKPTESSSPAPIYLY
jgi:hypothetical protein